MTPARLELLKRELLAAGDVAEGIIRDLRDARAVEDFTVGQASLALLIAAARVQRLRGMAREDFLLAAGVIWDIAADDQEKGMKR